MGNCVVRVPGPCDRRSKNFKVKQTRLRINNSSTRNEYISSGRDDSKSNSDDNLPMDSNSGLSDLALATKEFIRKTTAAVIAPSPSHRQFSPPSHGRFNLHLSIPEASSSELSTPVNSPVLFSSGYTSSHLFEKPRSRPTIPGIDFSSEGKEGSRTTSPKNVDLIFGPPPPGNIPPPPVIPPPLGIPLPSDIPTPPTIPSPPGSIPPPPVIAMGGGNRSGRKEAKLKRTGSRVRRIRSEEASVLPRYESLWNIEDDSDIAKSQTPPSLKSTLLERFTLEQRGKKVKNFRLIKRNGSRGNMKKARAKRIKVFNVERRKAIGIRLRSFKWTSTDIRKALDEINMRILNEDVMERLLKILPTELEVRQIKEEEARIVRKKSKQTGKSLSSPGTIVSLMDEEQFVMDLYRIPGCKQRLELLLFMSSFEGILREDLRRLNLIQHAIRPLSTSAKSGALRDFMMTILSCVNILNNTDIKGFRISLLNEMVQTRMTTGKGILMDVVIEHTAKSETILEDLNSVTNAYKIEYSSIRQPLRTLVSQMALAKKFIDNGVKDNGIDVKAMVEVVHNFYEHKHAWLETVCNDADELWNDFVNLRKFFCEPDIPMHVFFSIWNNFRGILHQRLTHLEKLKNAEVKQKVETTAVKVPVRSVHQIPTHTSNNNLLSNSQPKLVNLDLKEPEEGKPSSEAETSSICKKQMRITTTHYSSNAGDDGMEKSQSFEDKSPSLKTMLKLRRAMITSFSRGDNRFNERESSMLFSFS